MTNKQVVIWNLIAFAFIHLIIETITNAGNGSSRVVIQYLISYWIISGKIDSKNKVDLVKYTWIVSVCVFIARLVLGTICAFWFTRLL